MGRVGKGCPSVDREEVGGLGGCSVGERGS
jgi:hypothetical protein